MVKLNKISIEELLSLNQGISSLFQNVAGRIVEKGPEPTPIDWENYHSILQFQEDVQNEIKSRVYQYIPINTIQNDESIFEKDTE